MEKKKVWKHYQQHYNLLKVSKVKAIMNPVSLKLIYYIT